ncbi:hypothetical protein OH687_37715 [Burkholderia anthina]|nr:hypothetical protein OH687_37715 [Burkholderia anthina]
MNGADAAAPRSTLMRRRGFDMRNRWLVRTVPGRMLMFSPQEIRS